MSPASPPTDDRLSIKLLGGFSLWRNGVPLPRLPLQKSEHVLAYLVLHPGQAVSREQLASMFWPDADSEPARTSLRRVLNTIKSVLTTGSTPDGLGGVPILNDESSIVIGTRNEAQFAPPPGCQVD